MIENPRETGRKFIKVPVLAMDCDGTVRYSRRGPMVTSPEDVNIYPDVVPKIKNKIKEGYFPVLMQNAASVAYGQLTPKVLEKIAVQTIYLLGADVGMYFSAMAHPDGVVEQFKHRSLLRKPEIGMLAALEVELGKQNIYPLWDDSIVVGDKPEDKEMAERAGLHFEWAWGFFDRPHPNEGRSPWCAYCRGDHFTFNVVPVQFHGHWEHIEEGGKTAVQCGDQDWYRPK